MITDERVSQLEASLRRRGSKPDKETRMTLQVIDRLRITEATLLNVIEKPIGYSRCLDVEDLAEQAMKAAERNLRKEGKIK